MMKRLKLLLYLVFGCFVCAASLLPVLNLLRSPIRVADLKGFTPDSGETKYWLKPDRLLDSPVGRVARVSSKFGIRISETDQANYYLAKSGSVRLLVKSDQLEWPDAEVFHLRRVNPEEAEALGPILRAAAPVALVAEPDSALDDVGLALAMLFFGGAIIAYSIVQQRQAGKPQKKA